MKETDGITKIVEDNFSVFYIEELTESFKQLIKDEIVEICFGERRKNSPYEMYTAEKVIDNFLKRFDNSNNDSQKKGYIGEFILSVIIRMFFSDYKVINSFFNKEDQSLAKKGFDILLLDDAGQLWITESKAGAISKNQTIDQKITERINVAKLDLIGRLGEDSNEGLWYHSLNDVGLSLKDSDEKDMVETILAGGINNTNRDFSVVIGAIVFHDITDKFTKVKVNSTLKRITDSNSFKEIKIIAIQKETFEKIIEIMREIGEDNE